MENSNFYGITGVGDAGIPPQARKFPLNGAQTDAAFLHRVFQMLHFDTDASFSGQSACVSFDAGDRSSTKAVSFFFFPHYSL